MQSARTRCLLKDRSRTRPVLPQHTKHSRHLRHFLVDSLHIWPSNSDVTCQDLLDKRQNGWQEKKVHSKMMKDVACPQVCAEMTTRPRRWAKNFCKGARHDEQRCWRIKRLKIAQPLSTYHFQTSVSFHISLYNPLWSQVLVGLRLSCGRSSFSLAGITKDKVEKVEKKTLNGIRVSTYFVKLPHSCFAASHSECALKQTRQPVWQP